MGTPFVKRTPPLSPAINTSDIRSGDFLALSKIRGRWGGFETLQKWVTGAYAGHTAVALRDDKGDLWVIEGGQPDEQVRLYLPDPLKVDSADSNFEFVLVGICLFDEGALED